MKAKYFQQLMEYSFLRIYHVNNYTSYERRNMNTYPHAFANIQNDIALRLFYPI
jgi:hypothetical protein